MEKQKSRIFAMASAAALALVSQISSAADYSIIHAFKGTDGVEPLAGVVFDGDGNLYSTTEWGGSYAKGCNGGCGSVFKLAPDGTETVLHGFIKNGGAHPAAGLVFDKAGNLYGTTVSDKDKRACSPDLTCSTIYKISPENDFSIIHHFNTQSEGNNPSGLVLDKKDNLYGTTPNGGGASCDGLGCGAVFKFMADGTLKVLHAFAGGGDGSHPSAALLLDKEGNLYGTTYDGGGTGCSGAGCGTVFKIAPDGTETILYTFAGGLDGANPAAALNQDKDGNLYGTTTAGGGQGGDDCYNIGCGTVFRLTSDGTEMVLYAFRGGNDGINPFAGLVADKKGNLFGTTLQGGLGCPTRGCGTIFKLASDGKETILHRFTGGNDGAIPTAPLNFRVDGFLYGTTSEGGDDRLGSSGYGTVFKIKP